MQVPHDKFNLCCVERLEGLKTSLQLQLMCAMVPLSVIAACAHGQMLRAVSCFPEWCLEVFGVADPVIFRIYSRLLNQDSLGNTCPSHSHASCRRG